MASRRIATRLEQVDPQWAWARYEADQADRPSTVGLPWDLTTAAHLLRRAGFGASWPRLRQALADGPQDAVSRLLDGPSSSESFYEQLRQTARPLVAGGNLQNLPAWWLYAMLRTPHPLLEKTTLFWHGHFATSAAKVENARLMYQQNQLLRRHALGNFRGLLTDISRDPAMLLWLDSATNQKRHPNENYARELMELFTLGIGHYTEVDVKQAARAFTGWEVRDERFRFNPTQHDPGEKTVLGQRGPWQGDDVLGIILEQPAAARFIARKAFRFFVSETEVPPRALLEPLADGFRREDYDVRRLVETILRSNLFFSTCALHQRIKSPVELAVGMARALELDVNAYALADLLREMGQHVFFPPNVKGWDGGTAWITTTTMIARANLVPTLLAPADGLFAQEHPLSEYVERNDLTTCQQALDHLLKVLLAAKVPAATRDELLRLLGRDSAERRPDPDALLQTVQAITTLPEYQLC